MSNFKSFSQAVNTRFKTFLANDTEQHNMFKVNISGDELYEMYLGAFPEGTNKMFRERTEHDCSTCRNFIKNIGNAVFVKDGKKLTVWDIETDDPVYSVVAKAMSSVVASRSIESHFIVSQPTYGKEQTLMNGESWNHFGAVIPHKYLEKSKPSNYVGERKTDVAILKRSLEEITDISIDTVMELIAQGSLYRGDEFKGAVQAFSRLKRDYNAIKTDLGKELFIWLNATPHTRFRNTVIGTLLVDISDDVELDAAVGKYEAKTAPTNYKRPTALVTQKMIDAAKKKVTELGIEDSLYRRHAERTDISVNNVLFADGNVRELMIGGAFDNIKPTKKTSMKASDTVETVSIEKFLNDVLPTASGVDLLLEGKLFNNFVSLVAPVNANAKPLFKWENGFSWSYDGEVTDSIKERVKKAGGKVDGDVRVSLSWHNSDDLDMGIINKSTKQRVYFGSKNGFGCTLDVDTNGMGPSNYVDPVENIVFVRDRDMAVGVYDVYVDQYNKRGTANPGFEIEVEVLGQRYSFEYPASVPGNYREVVCTITKHKTGEIEVTGLVKKGASTREKWGLQSETWVNVDMVMKSPNFWDDKKIGNEHVFFMLKGCVNPDAVRGFYNEFLTDELNDHRKVLEMLASQMKAPYNENQLSGIGVSTTKKEELTVRVKGSINRVMKIKF